MAVVPTEKCAPVASTPNPAPTCQQRGIERRSQYGGRFVLIYLCSLTLPSVWPNLDICKNGWLGLEGTSQDPETVDLLVIRPHWYWTHDLSLIRGAFGPTELTRNRFKTVSDRGLWCRVKGLFTLPSIVSGFLFYHIKGAAAEESGRGDGSLFSASYTWTAQHGCSGQLPSSLNWVSM